MDDMRRITELENPNSVSQMRSWLADNGLETDTLGKKAVNEMLKTAPPELADALVLRQQLAKSSVKKYQAMQNAVCSDGRARGMFQFYGANRTGRWAGRLIQMQNLPQNHLSDLAEARGLVRSGNYEAVKMLYEDVPDTLSQLIRTAFIPREGAMFYVADFSAIRARSSHGSPESRGGRRSSPKARTSTVLRHRRCFGCRSKSMVSTDTSGKKARLPSSPSATAALWEL